MKKFILLGLICICLTGCTSGANKKALIGEWEYFESPWQTYGEVSVYEFVDEKKVNYYECKDSTRTDDACATGSAAWTATYKLNNNVVTLDNIKLDEENSVNYTEVLRGPDEKLIVDFENLYLCREKDGINCSQQYKKSTE